MLKNGGSRNDDLNKRIEQHVIKSVNRQENQPSSSVTSSTVTTMVSSPSVSIPSSSTTVSGLTQSNTHFLLTNPWLHTSLLYSQLYSQKVHSQSHNPSNTRHQIDLLDHNGGLTFHSPLPSPIPTKVSTSSINSSSIRNIRDKDAEGSKNNKRSDVWRPY